MDLQGSALGSGLKVMGCSRSDENGMLTRNGSRGILVREELEIVRRQRVSEHVEGRSVPGKSRHLCTVLSLHRHL
jgi:hypothetical protein